MTEPKWRHIDEVTEEMYREGSWVIPLTDKTHQSRNPTSTKLEQLKSYATHIYGPIRNPPKPPPKLRRFEATYRDDRVSGVSATGQANLDGFHGLVGIYRETGNRFVWVQPAELTEIKWLDTEN